MARSIDIACVTFVLAPTMLTIPEKVFQVTSPAYVLVIKLLRLIACSATNACCYLACAVNSLFSWHYVIRPTWHLFRNFVGQNGLMSHSNSIQKVENKLLAPLSFASDTLFHSHDKHCQKELTNEQTQLVQRCKEPTRCNNFFVY